MNKKKVLGITCLLGVLFLCGLKIGQRNNGVWDRGKFERCMYRYFDELEAAGKDRLLMDKLFWYL